MAKLGRAFLRSITGPPRTLTANSRAMAQATQPQPAPASASLFRERLGTAQPEVLVWVEQHLRGDSAEATIELAMRYFDTAARWGEPLPILKKARLNIQLADQVPTIDPRDRWMTELPIPAESGDRIAIGRMLRALVTVSQATL